jgi:hypothetical protein
MSAGAGLLGPDLQFDVDIEVGLGGGRSRR